MYKLSPMEAKEFKNALKGFNKLRTETEYGGYETTVVSYKSKGVQCKKCKEQIWSEYCDDEDNDYWKWKECIVNHSC